MIASLRGDKQRKSMNMFINFLCLCFLSLIFFSFLFFVLWDSLWCWILIYRKWPIQLYVLSLLKLTRAMTGHKPVIMMSQASMQRIGDTSWLVPISYWAWEPCERTVELQDCITLGFIHLYDKVLLLVLLQKERIYDNKPKH